MDCCRYTKFSNLINLMVQNNDFFKSYHLGWGADIDINILNNFNVDGITGDLYPRIQMLIPENGVINIDDNKATERLRVDLWLLDLQNRDNKGTPLNLTLIEQVDKLSCEGIRFINKLDALLDNYCFGYVEKNIVTTEIDDKRGKDALVLYQMSFFVNLIDEGCFEVDISDFDGVDIPCDDLENNCKNV